MTRVILDPGNETQPAARELLPRPLSVEGKVVGIAAWGRRTRTPVGVELSLTV